LQRLLPSWFFSVPDRSARAILHSYGTNQRTSARSTGRAGSDPPGGRGGPGSLGPGPGPAPQPLTAHGRPAPGPSAERPDRSVGRPPGGLPPSRPGRAEVPGAARAAGVPLAPLADRHDPPAPAPPPSGRAGPGRRPRGAAPGPALAGGDL